MTFRQRYAQLQDASFVKHMMLRSVYGTMALENQALRGADQDSERERLIAALLDDPRRIWRPE